MLHKALRSKPYEYAIAGACFIFIANILLSGLFSLSLLGMGVPAFLTVNGVGVACSTMPDDFWQQHGDLAFLWYRWGPEVLLIVAVIAGFLLHSYKKRKSGQHRSVVEWLSVLLIAAPLFKGSVFLWFLMVHLLKGLDISALFGGSAASIIVACALLLYCPVSAVWLYLNKFGKGERRYLWLLSLPAMALVYFGWWGLVICFRYNY